MSYIGKDVKSVSTANITVDSMTGDGSANTLALSLTMVDSIYDVAVYIDGLAKIPGVDYTLSNTTITFATPPSVDQKVVAISTGDAIKDNVIDNSFTVDSIKDNSITDAKIVGLDASKLTGALPAIDGSAITGIDGTAAIIQQSYNPTYGADVGEGSIWQNTTTGQFYVCTDGTLGANIWINVGTGGGLIMPWTYQGEISAHTFGGYIAHYGTDMLKKWNFASNTTASSKGNISGAGGRGTDGPIGVSGTTHGYVCGGYSADTGGYVSKISKISHASETENSVTTGAHLSNARSNTDGIGSEIAGYVFNAYPYTTAIDKFSFASDGSCAAVANTGVPAHGTQGQASTSHGYCSGGHDWVVGGKIKTIQKFDFASDSDSASVGDLAGEARYMGAGCSSATHGFVAGGQNGSYQRVSTIDKFSFANENDSVGHGDLAGIRYGNAGHSSTTDGYSSVGGTAYNGKQHDIHKFSFSSNTTAASHGSVGMSVYMSGGHQY